MVQAAIQAMLSLQHTDPTFDASVKSPSSFEPGLSFVLLRFSDLRPRLGRMTRLTPFLWHRLRCRVSRGRGLRWPGTVACRSVMWWSIAGRHCSLSGGLPSRTLQRVTMPPSTSSSQTLCPNSTGLPAFCRRMMAVCGSNRLTIFSRRAHSRLRRRGERSDPPPVRHVG